MITVSITTFDWQSIPLHKELKLTELSVMLTSVVVVVMTHNLAIGVFSGVLLSLYF